MGLPLISVGESIDEALRWANLTDLVGRLPGWLLGRPELLAPALVLLLLLVRWLAGRRSRSRPDSAAGKTRVSAKGSPQGRERSERSGWELVLQLTFRRRG
jgi:hypothetical protein